MKEKFLKELERKLSVLSNEEIKDIIDEYSGIIDDKVKHGKTEEEAVKEFGDIKELSKEILKAYKIDPNYNKSDFTEKTNDFIKSSEEFIKKGAKKLTDVTEEVIDNIKGDKNRNELENVFEIILKIVFVLLVLAVLRIPFFIIGSIGSGIFDLDMFPLGGISSFLWDVLIGLLYIVLCVIVIVTVINKHTNYQKTDKKKETKPKKEMTIEQLTKEEKNYDYSRNNNNIAEILILIAKIWCIVIILIPLWFVSIGLMMVISFIIYLIIKGISLYGILLLLFGIFGMFSYFADSIWRGLFSRKRVYFYPLFINLILILFGSLMTFDYLSNIKYIDSVPNSIDVNTKTYTTTIDGMLKIAEDEKQIVDNSLEDNVVKIEVDYYSDIYNNINISINKVSDDNASINNLIINENYNNDFKFNHNLYKETIEQLKNDTIFNYSLLNKLTVKIYANEKTMELIK